MSDLEHQKIRNNLTDIHRELNHTRCEIQRMNETLNRIATALEKRAAKEATKEAVCEGKKE